MLREDAVAEFGNDIVVVAESVYQRDVGRDFWEDEIPDEERDDYFSRASFFLPPDGPSQSWANQCNHPSHNPPNMLYIPGGKTYTHVCPSCVQETVLQSSSVRC